MQAALPGKTHNFSFLALTKRMTNKKGAIFFDYLKWKPHFLPQQVTLYQVYGINASHVVSEHFLINHC